LLLAPSPGGAISPGSADRKAALPNVCQQGPFRGRVCDPTAFQPCGRDRLRRPYECSVDFPAATLRGTLTLISDEAVGDNASFRGNPAITVLMEFEKGPQRFFVAKTFQSATPGMFPEIGHWLAPRTEDEIDGVIDSFVYQTPFSALEDVGEALLQVASQVLGHRCTVSAATPVIFDLTEASHRPATDQYARTDLGQVARFHVQIKFVEP
jgi:hypothetical protein